MGCPVLEGEVRRLSMTCPAVLRVTPLPSVKIPLLGSSVGGAGTPSTIGLKTETWWTVKSSVPAGAMISAFTVIFDASMVMAPPDWLMRSAPGCTVMEPSLLLMVTLPKPS